MPLIPQVRRIIFNDEEIGMGFNSQSGLAIGTALKDFTVQADPIAPGQEVDAEVTIINTHEDLMEKLGMSFEAQGRYGFFSASAKADFSNSANYNSTSTFVVARCVVKNPLKRGHNFKVIQEAQDLLDSLREEEFQETFGDSFVRGLQTGGEFYSVVRITSVSESTQNDLSATLQAEMNGLVAAGSFKGEFNQAKANASTRSEHAATMYQKAGIGAQISPVVTVEEVIDRFKKFPEIVHTSSAAYETEVATYNTLPLRLPTPEERDAFIFALRDARDKKLHYIQTGNDLEFARRNPTFFRDLPSNDVLSNAINVYTRLTNAVTDHAVRLSRGQIEPPRVFDPSELSPPLVEPAPIPLQRATPTTSPQPATIRVPNMIGLEAADIELADRCTDGGSVDACLDGSAMSDQDGNPIPIRVPREVAEFLQIARGKVRITFDPPFAASAPFECAAQFPSAGALVAPGSEVIFQFKEVPIEPVS